MVKGISTGRCSVTCQKRGETSTCIVRENTGPIEVQFESGVDIHALREDELARSYRRLMAFIDSMVAFRRLKMQSKLSAVRDHLLGPGSILFQDMALSKPAKIGSEKPWHQDNAYFKYAPLEDILGIWIALDDATVENGCMQVIPTPRDRCFAYKHTHTVDCDIDAGDLDLQQVEAIEIPAGGALFFFGMLPHHTPPNPSERRRRALQLHYRSAQTVCLDQEAYARLFTTPDGAPATCETEPTSSLQSGA